MNQLAHDPTTYAEYIAPTWILELASGLSIRSQFVISGNIRDLYPMPGFELPEFVRFEATIWQLFAEIGFEALLIHDPVRGLRLHPECDERYDRILRECGLELGSVAETPDQLARLTADVMGLAEIPVALMLDYVSGLVCQQSSEIDKLFITMDQLARAPASPRPDAGLDCPPRNPVLWLVDRPGDMPGWFVTGNPEVQDLKVELPDLNDRLAFTRREVTRLADYPELGLEQRERRIEEFAVVCDGMTLVDLRNIVALAEAEGIRLDDIQSALRSYRLGTSRNPWTSSVVRTRVRNAMPVLEQRVKGQARALERTYDILIRSIMGLSGAQTTNRGSRPRGVLFFVGPTGVGKTELAKAVAEVMFGDESTMNRFDMSEFMDASSIGRLVGPPPGAPGHENGGDLVNAVRSRPFSVFLFDEIEKAHPRILDVFLQVLDDGRVSDSRGETGYFSEALIIFTSNVGMTGGDKSNNGGQNVLPSDSPDALEHKLYHAVSSHFRNVLNRPELFNRLGQNIVPFQFINRQSSEVIFNAVTGRVIVAVREEHGIEIKLSDQARANLKELCTMELNDGGRGIGNRIESNFINPLARTLFKQDGATELNIDDVVVKRGEPRLVIT